MPSGTEWISTVLGPSEFEFSRGGSSYRNIVPPEPTPGFGNGGSVVPAGAGRNGYDGIVIIRFFREADAQP
jgi:hypothetical protein